MGGRGGRGLEASGAARDGGPEDDPDTEGVRPEGAFVTRRNDGYHAYDEWMPIRLPAGRTEQEMRIYRRLRFGTLADLTMLDLRQYRDQQVPDTDGEAIDDPDPGHDRPGAAGLPRAGPGCPRLAGLAVGRQRRPDHAGEDAARYRPRWPPVSPCCKGPPPVRACRRAGGLAATGLPDGSAALAGAGLLAGLLGWRGRRMEQEG